jgi:acetoin utilization deacetylase AcuC-like enzyme
MSARFGYVFDARMLRHDTGMVAAPLADGSAFALAPHPSNALITEAIDALIQASGLAAQLRSLPARCASQSEVALVHAPKYVARVAGLAAAGGGDAGDVAPIGPHSHEAALLAAGGALVATDAILDGAVDGAYVLARPPGHHARPALGMGYCLFNNVAIAVRHARRRGVARALIVDWDVHHGNGTQEAFYDDPSVLVISLHQEEWYPRDTGALQEQGTDDGAGYTINVPLPPGTGDRGYLEALHTIVAPAARRFRPEIIAISAGQDPAMLDPLGRMLVSARGFAGMGTAMRALADEICDGRLLVLQEGGYSQVYTPICTLFLLGALSGAQARVRDPYEASTEQAYAERVLSRATADALAAARRAHAAHLAS